MTAPSRAGRSVPQPPSSPLLARRSVLLGAAGLAGTALLAAACGSSGGSGSSDIALDPDDGAAQLQAIFDFQNGWPITGSPQRLTFGIIGSDGSYTTDAPASLDFQLSFNGTDVG